MHKSSALKALVLLSLALPLAAKPLPYHSSIQLKANEKLSSSAAAVKFSPAQAEAIAQKAAPHAKVLKTKLENEEGNVVYEVLLQDGKQEREILVDPGNGKILSNQIGEDKT